jgi:hypothetical protein
MRHKPFQEILHPPELQGKGRSNYDGGGICLMRSK